MYDKPPSPPEILLYPAPPISAYNPTPPNKTFPLARDVFHCVSAVIKILLLVAEGVIAALTPISAKSSVELLCWVE